MAVLEQACQLAGLEALQAGPETDVRIGRHLALHADQALDGPGSRELHASEQHLPLQQRAVQRPRPEDRLSRWHGSLSRSLHWPGPIPHGRWAIGAACGQPTASPADTLARPMPLETSNDARPTPGAIRQAAIAGALGLLLAAAGWYVAIPVLSGIAIAVGFFLVAMAIYTQLVLRRRRAKARRIEP
jgi:hypothetical protein